MMITTRAQKKSVVILVFMVIIATLISFSSFTTYKSYKMKSETYTFVYGQVINYEYVTDYEDNERRAVVVQYNVAGKDYTLSTYDYSFVGDAIGNIVGIKYNPSDPSDAIFEWQTGNILATLFSVIVDVILILSIILTIRRNKKIDKGEITATREIIDTQDISIEGANNITSTSSSYRKYYTSNVSNKKQIFFGALILCVGIFMTIFLVKIMKTYNDHKNTFIPCMAKVVDYRYTKESRRRNGSVSVRTLNASLVEYTVDGKVYTLVEDVYGIDKIPLGTEIQIRYNPNAPGDAMFENEESFKIVFFVNVMCYLVGGVFFIQGIRDKRKKC